MKDFLFVKSLILIRVMRVINELRRRSIHYYSSDSEKIKVPQRFDEESNDFVFVGSSRIRYERY